MARRLKKLKRKAGSAVKSVIKKGGRTSAVIKTSGKVIDRLSSTYTGSSISEVIDDYSEYKKPSPGQAIKSKRSSKKESSQKRRRHKGVVPKTVRKWAGKITRRRKQEEKIVKKLFGADGGKIVKKSTARSSSPGYITKQELNEAMRR